MVISQRQKCQNTFLYVCQKPKEANDVPKIQKNRFIQADFSENICIIDIFYYKGQIIAAYIP